MLSRENLIIIYLSIALSVTQYLWLRAERKASYLEGQQSVYASFDRAVNDAVGPK